MNRKALTINVREGFWMMVWTLVGGFIPELGGLKLNEHSCRRRRLLAGLERESLFLDGYVERRIAAGDRRTYRYPLDGGLPPVTRESQVMESSFVVALREEKERQGRE